MIIISCGKTKAKVGGEARDLYTGGFFITHKNYCNHFYGDDWYILSAKHGVVKCTDMLEPYDVSFYNKSSNPVTAEFIVNQSIEYTDPTISLSAPVYTNMLREAWPEANLITPLIDAGVNTMGCAQRAMNDSVAANTPLEVFLKGIDLTKYRSKPTTDEDIIEFITSKGVGYMSRTNGKINNDIRDTNTMSCSSGRLKRILNDLRGPSPTLDPIL